MAFIFVSYRREDSEHASDRIYETLVERFGRSETFKDVDAIPLGPDFRDVLTKAINDSDVLLAVIGDRWLSVEGPNGTRRLDDDNDFVRIEIEGALRCGKTVIPLLVGRAPMPKPEDLAPSLQGLAYRNGMPIRAGRDFKHDMNRLISELESIRTATSVTPAPTATDDGDVLEMWRQKKASIEQRQAQVQVLVAEHQDYAQAVELLESIPPRLRDENLFQSLSQRRDRVLLLDREVRRAVDAMDLDGLRPKVAELQALKPQRRDLPQLIDMLSLHEQARSIIEEKHDYAMALSILNKLPEELRDPELYPKVVSLNERILQLENEIRTNRQAGNLSDVQRDVVSLLELLPHRNDLVQLRDSIALHQQAADLFNKKHDSSGALRLLAAVPADIRDSRLYESVKRQGRMEELENEIGQHIDSGRILGLGPKIEELSTLDPDSETVRHLAGVIEKNEEAHRLLEQNQNVLAAAEVLYRIPADRRDRELSCKVENERILQLENEIRTDRQAGKLSDVQRHVVSLLEILPHRNDLVLLRDSIALHQQAADLFNKKHDSSGALRLLAAVPADIRDSRLYESVKRQGRMEELENEIGQHIDSGRILGLGPKIEELSTLDPDSETVRHLAGVIEKNEEAHRLIEQNQNVLAAAEVLYRIPADRRDRELSCKVEAAEHRIAKLREDRITKLGAEFAAHFASGPTAALSPILLELSHLTVKEEQGQDLYGLASGVETLAISWRQAMKDHDHALAVELLERLPESLRDTNVFRELVAVRDRTMILEKAIRNAIRQRRFIGVRDKLDEFLEYRPDYSEFSSLQRIISANEEAMAMFPAQGQVRTVLTKLDSVMKSIPSEMHDTEICEVRKELLGVIERRLKASRRFLRIAFVVATLGGGAFGYTILQSMAGIAVGIMLAFVLISPAILLGFISDHLDHLCLKRSRSIRRVD